MERGNSINGNLKLPKSTSGTKLPEKSTNNVNADENSEYELVREQDRYMPIANVIRIMRRILPSHAKISDEAKETIQECVSEFISFVTGEANERCQREQRKTITAEDVLWSMGKLGFDEYMEPLTLYLQRYREFEGERAHPIRRSVEMAPLAPGYPPQFHMGHHQGMLPPPPMNGYFRDNSNQGGMGSFDPYALYK